MRGTRILAGLAVGLALASGPSARAGEAEAADAAGPSLGGAPPDRIQALEQNLGEALRQIDALRAELDDLKRQQAQSAGSQGPAPAAPSDPEVQRAFFVPGTQGALVAQEGTPAPSGTQQGQPSPGAPTPAPQARPAPKPVEEEAESAGGETERPQVTPELLRRTSAVLLPQNILEIDPGFAYTYTNRNLLNVAGLDILETIFIGRIEVQKVRRSLYTPSVALRYGITDRIQASVSVPYTISDAQFFLPPQVQRPEGESGRRDERFTDSGIGDVDVGLSFHALRETSWFPDVVFAFNVKSDTGGSPFVSASTNSYATGTGFWGLRGGATLVRVSDPAVFFANVGYFYHIPDDVGRFGKIDPSDSIDWGVGLSYSLNPFLAFSTRFASRIVSKTEIAGEKVSGSNQVTGTLQIGMTYGYGPNRSFDFSVGIGLTEDSPDFTAAISTPFSFNLGPLWTRVGSWF